MQESIREAQALALEHAHLDTAMDQLRKAIANEPVDDLRARLTRAAAEVADVNMTTIKRSADIAELHARTAPTEQEK